MRSEALNGHEINLNPRPSIQTGAAAAKIRNQGFLPPAEMTGGGLRTDPKGLPTQPRGSERGARDAVDDSSDTDAPASPLEAAPNLVSPLESVAGPSSIGVSRRCILPPRRRRLRRLCPPPVGASVLFCFCGRATKPSGFSRYRARIRV